MVTRRAKKKPHDRKLSILSCFCAPERYQLGCAFHMNASGLVWSPIFNALQDRIESGDDLILLLVPFVKLAALKKLFQAYTNIGKIKIICRWRLEDLVSGVSDVEVFTYLRDRGCDLYINPDIH